MLSRFRFIGLCSLILVVGALLVLSFRSPWVVTKEASGVVSLVVDFGDSSASGVRSWKNIPYVTGVTAFSILKQEVEKAQMPLMYDPSTGAGVFIRQIGDKKNGDGRHYWQYWVNGKFATVAADNYALSAGDIVQWKFAAEQKE